MIQGKRNIFIEKFIGKCEIDCFINSTSQVVGSIKIPTQFVEASTFGGEDMSKLFVMTGSVGYNLYTNIRPTNDTVNESAGKLIIIENPGAKGIQAYEMNV